jgi:hypothetical protein
MEGSFGLFFGGVEQTTEEPLKAEEPVETTAWN